MRKTLTGLFVLAALVLLAVSIYYFVTKAGSLPHWAPGYIAGSTHVHTKHGLAALILAVGFGILAWFASGKKTTT